jgi:Zn-dependent protease
VIGEPPRNESSMTADPGFADEQAPAHGSKDDDEALYQQACVELVRPSAARPRGDVALLLLTMALFVAITLWQTGFSVEALQWWLLPLVGVILLHEAGHYAGMRLFGYRDVRMFFIPFFGAAVTGKKHAAPAWQQAIVLLLGPLPGIALGVALAMWQPAWLTIPLIFILLAVNGFNLLPVYPLDGGKLLHVLLFSRRPAWTTTLLALSGLAMAALAWWESSWVSALIAAALLIGAPTFHFNRLRRDAERSKLPAMPERLEELDEDQLRALYQSARRVNPDAKQPKECANEMRLLHEESVTKSANLAATVALLATYGASIIVVVTALQSIFFFTESDDPSLWSVRHLEDWVSTELKLDQIELRPAGPGEFAGEGATTDGIAWKIEVTQDAQQHLLTWKAVNDAGARRSGRLQLDDGVIVDMTIRP